MTFRALGAATLLSALGLALAGCAQHPALPPCPPVYMLADARHVTQFLPGKPHDLIDMVAAGEIVGWHGRCGYKPADGKAGGTASVDLEVTFEAKRGPANTDGKAHFTYFVAIPAYYPKPQAKAMFNVTIPFPKGIDTVRQADVPIILTLPVKSEDAIRGVPIYLGFQITPAQLRYNRENN